MMDLYNHLLKAPGKSVSEIAEIIYGVAGTGPVDQALEVYDASGEMIGATIYSHLDFERFKSDDGKFREDDSGRAGKRRCDRYGVS